MRGRKLRRGISPAITTLVLVSVAIAVGLIVGIILYTQTRAMGTKGSSLQLYVDAHDIGNGYNAITVNVKNTGPEDVRISSISVYVGGTTKSCNFNLPNNGVIIKAGGTGSFATVCQTNQGVGGKIAVVVTGETTQTSITVKASASAEVLP
mgnify:CR=1 FL=1